MKKHLLATNALLNTLRQLGAIAFPLITFPYVSRVLQVAGYGKYTFSNSIVNYFCMFAALGITNYAIREGSGLRHHKEKLEKFSNEVFTINIVTMLIAYALLIGLLIAWPKLHNYRSLILIQSLTIIFNTIGVEWLYSIYEDFAYVTVRSLCVQFVALILMFLFVRQKSDYVNYATITVLAAGGGNLFGFIYSRKYLHLKISFHPNYRQHIIPMLVLFFNTVAVTIYANSDITLLGIFKGDHTVGLYNVAVRIYTIVKQLLNATVIVILPRVSLYLRENKQRQYQKLLDNVFRVLIILILPATVGLFMLSKEIIMLIAGSAYFGGTQSLRILSIAIMFSIFASFITTGMLLPKRREKKILTATLIGAVINILLNLVMIPFLSLNGAALTTLLAEFMVFIISLIYARDIYQFKKIIMPLFTTMISCVPVILSCFIAKEVFTSNIWIILFSVLLSGILYSIIQVVFFYINRRRNLR